MVRKSKKFLKKSEIFGRVRASRNLPFAENVRPPLCTSVYNNRNEHLPECTGRTEWLSVGRYWILIAGSSTVNMFSLRCAQRLTSAIFKPALSVTQQRYIRLCEHMLVLLL